MCSLQDMLGETKSSQAPGQLLGYSLQITECLRQLLVAPPGTTVSVEVFEDVGLTSASEQKTAIQTKSSLTGNPIADRSIDLWKTLSNWIKAIKAGQLPVDGTSFRIHVFAPKSGTIADSFAAAETDTAAEGAIAAARNELWGAPPKFPKKADVTESLRPYLETFFTADKTMLVQIVKHFELSFGSGVSRLDLEPLLANKWAPEEMLDHVLDKCLGWVKSQVDSALEKQQPAAITVDAFNRDIGAFISKLRFQNILSDFAGDPSLAEVELHKLKMYVRQLELIETEEDEILAAINSYLRAAVNRTEWAKRGLVWENSFDQYEKSLCTLWKNTKKQHDLDHSAEAEEKRGQRLLVECMRQRKPLEGREVPDDFTPGSFHALADVLSVGWHPDYKSVLSAGQKAKE